MRARWAVLTFQPQFTAQLAANAQGQLVPQARTGSSFADFLLGLPATGQMVGLPLIPYRFTQVNPYFQDTWKVTRNFTLNYGIAWFLSTVPEPVGSAAKLPHGFDEKTGLLQYAALGQVDPEDAVHQLAQFHAAPGICVAAWVPQEHSHSCRRGNILCRHEVDRSAVRDGGSARSTRRSQSIIATTNPDAAVRTRRKTSFPRRRRSTLDETTRHDCPTAQRPSCCGPVTGRRT